MNYWLVGAMPEGRDRHDEMIRRGYWYCVGPGDTQVARVHQVQRGDRIAIKKMLGAGATEIEIRAIGIVTDVEPGQLTVYVNWLLTRLERRVETKGVMGAISRPYQVDEPEFGDWLRQVFCI